ncbi:MAG TPA: PAS domain S-box protein [Xanthobacteraceae bacterium]|jgi:PAS domain S-box-containing protein|nr:PAS domain S-box protein [Xanthobacteraceae bacterium]
MNDRYRLLVESSPSGICLVQENLIRYVNPAMARMFGYAVEELVDRLGPLDMVYPDDHSLVLENIRGRIEGNIEESRYECRALRKDGSVFPVEIHGRRIEFNGKPGIAASVVDSTDRRRGQDELRASEQRFRDYSEIVSDWFWESGPDHRFSRISGKPPDWGISERFIGSYRWDLASDREDESEKWRAHFAILEAHEPFRGFRYRIARPDGSALYMSASGKPLFDADGKFLGYRGTAADVTAEVRAEQAELALREARLALAHANRVETVGLFAASIAHEVNQPIAAAIMGAETAQRWLARQPPDTERAGQAIGNSLKDTQRAADVIRQIRALVKKAPERKDDLKINEAISEVIELARGEISKNSVALRTKLAEALPLVQGDRVQLQQVMLNLIVNAVEAMSQTGASRRELLISSESEADCILVAVRDSGPGLPEAALERPFEAFYTTKSTGLGMGLSICRSIVEAHGGRLWATANAPIGAVFQFTIPVIPAGAGELIA